MKYNLISPNEVKITFSRSDMKENNLTYKEVSYSNPNLRNVLKSCISEALNNYGLNEWKSLCIEVFPEQDGGFSAYIRHNTSLLNTYVKSNDDDEFNVYITALFNDLISLEKCCKILKSFENLIKTSTLYHCNDGYTLCIQSESIYEFGRKMLYSVINEWSLFVNIADDDTVFLPQTDDAKLVAEDSAIGIISKLR